MQKTLKQAATFEGIGLHSGKPVRMVVRPARAGHGVVFRRTDVSLGDTLLPARWDLVDRSPLCTRLVNAAGLSVSTIEHVMAALAGCGIHNALIDIDGPEVPILDGSALPFVQAFLAAGTTRLGAPIRALEILRPVQVEMGEGWARLEPSELPSMAFHIEFSDAAIGRQEKRLVLSNGAFVRELSDSRTFCRQADVDAMHEQGLALGGTLDNAVVVDGDAVLSPGGLRHADEAVRHKMLDALGDLALAGAPILGHYTGHRAGHAMTNTLLRALFDAPGACRFVTCDAGRAAALPGIGVQPTELPEVA
ncbi:UDP-3-O-acyl-N-acetylglucosamine deacetylase [Aquicoccus sp. SCR17]|nr:UDP-3-O-acyl-N-acetylglucosamine deacetylase [Carideicomes alvinocaridis]